MPYAVTTEEGGKLKLAEFQQLLIGTWKNDEKLMEGDKPLSFNVMPLPQAEPQPGNRRR